MVKIYIDESGSLTNTVNSPREEFFIISLVHVKNPNILKNSFNRFIKKYKNELLEVDNGQMFDKDGNLKELKGSSLTPDLKIKFLDYICIRDSFKAYYVKVKNRDLNNTIVRNKEVGFNYIIDKLMYYKINSNHLPQNVKYYIQIDQRSVTTRLQYNLEAFLTKSLTLDNNLISDLELHYRDSKNVRFIQIADFFANLIFSSCHTTSYDEIIKEKRNKGYISHEYNFPYVKK